ncbi:unnamed protein product [Didymodactylos carnosus]|uniref:Uncharacterized protein n=1 Tax=Didymodactylos carnosus TaxID=1234261 RepID=A0A815KAZ8_9BILA|nr:unnamed protein product [Didymodactylos carnosus]CAF1393323.1 unnamed protein product [Didymodactylos carnosus]CAF4188674.1 unnamed protein product [Didymodactylos carnosus]CAF4287626.1 unnamed protein product [Didymodactylos carnosus]
MEGSVVDYDPKVHWNPELLIDNNVGDLKEQTSYTVISHPDQQSSEICEHRMMKGTFWESLELQHFPFDVQDLSIGIMSGRTASEVKLKQDERLSTINTRAFGGQLSWKLYEHVETKQHYRPDFTNSQKVHPVFVVTCRASRCPEYFAWNGLFLMFLITLFAFPTVRYLTLLDRYSLVSIVFLVFICFYHAAIAIAPFQQYGDRVGTDRLICLLFFIVFVLFHIIFAGWLYVVVYKRRRELKKKDDEYNEILGRDEQARSSNVNKRSQNDERQPLIELLMRKE